MNVRSIFRPCAAAVVVATALLAACGGGSSSSSTAGQGTLHVALTDAPACGYDEVNVTVEKVRVHQSSTAGESDGGWSEVVLNPALRVNLLDLTNGVLAELGQTELPAGTYSQLRLQLAANSASAPFANSVLPSGGSEVALDTPSAQQSGLKMNLNLTVAANELADVVLDFDACKSVVKRGNSGRYNLKPVVTVLPRVRVDGLVAEGMVAAAIALPTTTVSLQQAGAPVRATVPDSTGRFVLYPVPAGTYDLVVSAEGRVTAVMTGVPISDSSRTFATPAGTAIDPPAGTARTISGAVSIAGSTTIPLATLRARQNRRDGHGRAPLDHQRRRDWRLCAERGRRRAGVHRVQRERDHAVLRGRPDGRQRRQVPGGRHGRRPHCTEPAGRRDGGGSVAAGRVRGALIAIGCACPWSTR